METNQVTPIGALIFIIFSIGYLIVFFIVQFKIFDRRGKNAERFCEQAEREGRMVAAHRESYRIVEGENNRLEYIGKYSYTAPNGKRYRMRFRDCQGFVDTPPETRTLYLERRNYRNYYTKGSLNMGKHGSGLYLLSIVVGFCIYVVLVNFVITPLIY